MVICWGTVWFFQGQGTANSKGVSPYQPYIKKIEAQLKTKRKDPRLLTILGRLYQKDGQPQRAKVLFLRALRYRPSYHHAQIGLARLALQKRQWRRAQRLLRGVLRRHPRLAAAWSVQAEILRAQAQNARPKQQKRLLQRSLQAYEKAIRLAPKHARYAYSYALLRLGLHQLPEAQVGFLRAVSLQPSHPCYQLGLATTERMMLRHTKQLYQRLWRWYPQCPHRLLRRIARPIWVTSVLEEAQLLRKKKQGSQAHQLLREVLRLEPKATRGYMFLAMTLYQDRQCAQARKVLHQLLSIQPNYRPAQRLLKRSDLGHCSPPRPTKR
ncbi:MAG: tetratricopeptide repeat protein [Myxococcales bacterium]|nr:tetratricopeptide repeat protein [Myxococcales bacterium]